MKTTYCLQRIFFTLSPHHNNFIIDNTEMKMKKILAASVVLAFVLTGCNTVKGVGKDVSKAGQAVTTTAEKTSDEIRRN